MYSSFTCASIEPKLISLKSNLVVALFPLMKLLPAKYVIEKELKKKFLSEGQQIVIESSSGSYALGLANVCKELGLPFHIIGDQVIKGFVKDQIELLGGTVELIPEGSFDPQQDRLTLLAAFMQKHPGCFWTRQYNNPDNMRAYYPFADLLLERLGHNLIVVAAVGSGSSACGTIEHLRRSDDHIQLIGVDTFGSILFGLPNGKRALRGLGNSIMPKNLIHSFFDSVHWISAEQAYLSTRTLFQSYAIFAGPTTGACFQVAQWVAKQHPTKTVVFLSPDNGYRYLDTVYCHDWEDKLGVSQSRGLEIPHEVSSLKQLDGKQHQQWVYLNWNRRTLKRALL